jgi:hypothetical protein
LTQPPCNPVAMPSSDISKNGFGSQAADDIRALVHHSIVDLDQGHGPLEEYKAAITAKPFPAIHPLIQKLDAKIERYERGELSDQERIAMANSLADTAMDFLWHSHRLAQLARRLAGTDFSIGRDPPPKPDRAAWRFFAEHPELLKQINDKGTNGHDVTKNASDVTENGSPLRGRPPTGRALTPAERVRKYRANKQIAAQRNGGGLIDQLFPKDSPACDIDWEQDDGGAFMRGRAAKWQLLEAERLAVEFALLRDGTTSAEVNKGHISTALKIARHWVKLADKLRNQRRHP